VIPKYGKPADDLLKWVSFTLLRGDLWLTGYHQCDNFANFLPFILNADCEIQALPLAWVKFSAFAA
jgi:hypothetical protein